MRIGRYFLLACLFLCCLSQGSAQDVFSLPKLRPSYVNHFQSDSDPFSNTCLDKVILDQRGRIWANTCGAIRLVNALGVLQFDGYRFKPVELFDTLNQVIRRPSLLGISHSGEIYASPGGGDLIAFNPDTRETRTFQHDNSILIRNVMEGSDKTYLLGSYPSRKDVSLFALEGDKIVELAHIPFGVTEWVVQEGGPLLVDEKDIWFMGKMLPLFRYDKKSKEIRQYSTESFLGPSLEEAVFRDDIYKSLSRILRSKQGDLYFQLSASYGGHLYRFDPQSEKFLSLAPEFPEDWQCQGIFSDQAGNICFLFLDKMGNNQAVLEDPQGKRFLFSPVLPPQEKIFDLQGEDFRKQVFLVGKSGLSSIGVQEYLGIKTSLEGKWIAGMHELPDGRILVNTILDGWFVYDPKEEVSYPFQGPDCGTEPPAFGQGMKQQIIPDKQGNLWFVSHEYLVRYNPKTQGCESFNLEKKLSLFGFLNDHLLVVQTIGWYIKFFDIQKGKLITFGKGVPDHMDELVRDLFIDSKGLLWIPTNNGLWKIDLDQETSEVLGLEQGFADFRFTSIYEDPRGIFWIGTYYKGLHRYDPESGSIDIINTEKGLSSNAIMSILPDDAGNIWVSTEYGLNVLSPEGNVLFEIYEEDGLVSEKFERFDAYKARDGKLYFGTPQGINIVDPTKLIDNLRAPRDLQVYLTEVTYYDEELEKEVVHQTHLDQLGTLKIPPSRPYLNLKFALSNYLEPQKNRYAYKLEGMEESWNYLGTQPELNLSRVPPGKYRLLINGADLRNNWSTRPVTLEIHARDFFYKQVWFYLLLALPFVIFGLIWARNKLSETRRLEAEVVRRTQKIEEDKRTIEAQAQELRQLDEMKSRFFTNISHELRTPITLITAPVENLIQRYAPSMDQKVTSSLRVILKNARKLGSLVEELLELSSLEMKKVSLKLSPTSITPFSRQVFHAYESGATLKKIRFTFHSEISEEAIFQTDRNRLEKILNNLLSNALKFTPENGAIEMRLHQVKNKIHIAVEDSGRGIPPEDLPHVFDRYFQTRREDIPTSGGTGVGLALCWELAKLMEGELWVTSEWGKGTCFTLEIPALVAETSKTEAPQTQPTPVLEEEAGAFPLPEAVKGERPTLLMVEDNPDMQELLQSLLADSYECIIANHGEEAVNLLEAADGQTPDIDLILSDVMMPVMDGYALLEKIKGHETWRKLPVIMLTARAAEEDKLQALRMGVDDYLHKPFSPDELRARVANLIANYQVRKSLLAKEPKAETEQEVSFEFEPAESVDYTWLKKVEEAAKEALEKGFKLTTSYLAEHVFLSDRQFSRKLKALTGLSPNQYIQEAKLQKARHLLESKAYETVKEVAHASGFSSASYLAKVYQEHFGKTPGDYLA